MRLRFRSEGLLLALSACWGADPSGEASTPAEPAPVQAAPEPDAPDVAKPAAPDAVPTGKPRALRGTLTFSPLGFRACDGEAVAVVGLEEEANEVREVLGEVGPTIYVELRARADADGRLDVFSVDTAVAEGPGCALKDVPWRLAAHGTEPFWSAEVHESLLRFRRMDDAEAFEAVATSPDAPSPGRRVWTGTTDGKTLAIDVRRARCEDAMASAFYPYTATVRFDDKAYDGCARSALDR